MTTNLDRYQTDLDDLIARGESLHLAMQAECHPTEFKKALGSKAQEVMADLPSFTDTYQAWYSEAQTVIRQILPERLNDFVRLYEKPKTRKEIDYENYRIEDFLQGLTVTQAGKEIVGPYAAIPHFRQQLSILKAAKSRFKSSLFDIRQLVQADLFDSELGAARSLAERGFLRAGGAISGVVLERHLGQVCANHSLKIGKKTPAIADFNDALKAADVVDTATWRFIQYLADIRNLCDHSKGTDPTPEMLNDLTNGVSKILKTLF